jgi:hypothetical protein
MVVLSFLIHLFFGLFLKSGKLPALQESCHTYVQSMASQLSMRQVKVCLSSFIVPLSLEMLCKICVESIANSSHHEHG